MIEYLIVVGNTPLAIAREFFVPEIRFLSEILVFETMVLTVFFPLGIQVISGISEKYKSEVITKQYSSSCDKYFYIFLLINIATIILIIFFNTSDANGIVRLYGYGLVAAWFVILSFVVITIITLLEILKFIKISTKPSEYIIENVGDKYEPSTIKGIGDILIFETKQRKNNLIFDGLERIGLIIKKIEQLKKDDPEKFEQLIRNKEFVENYRQKKEKYKFLPPLIVSEYHNRDPFTLIIHQFVRIYETAIEHKNTEVSELVVGHLLKVLAIFSSSAGNDFFVKILLDKIREIGDLAIKNNDDKNVSYALFRWYINNSEYGKKKADISYLDIFNRHLLNAISLIISHQNKLFEEFIDYAVGNNITFVNKENPIRELLLLFSKIDQNKYKDQNDGKAFFDKNKILEECQNFNTRDQKINTTNEREAWLQDIKNFIDTIYKNAFFDQDLRDKIRKKFGEIEEYANSWIWSQKFLEVMWEVGETCLYLDKSECIKAMWEYNKGKGCANYDIIPSSLTKLLRLYFGTSLYMQDYFHGKEYDVKYFLLFLAYISQKEEEADIHKLLTRADLSEDALRYIVNSNNYINFINKLKKEDGLLSKLGIINIDKSFYLLKDAAAKKLNVLQHDTKTS